MFYRVTDQMGNCTIIEAPDGNKALSKHLMTFGPQSKLHKEPNIEELPEGVADDLEVFHNLSRYKWLEGRKEYAAQGHLNYDANTVQELQEELLDVSNYCSVLYREIEKVKEVLSQFYQKEGEDETKKTKE